MHAPHRALRLGVTSALALLAVGCATGGGAPRAEDAAATEAEWRALARPRPEPVAGAPRVSFSGVELASSPPWTSNAAVGAELSLSELVIAGLLRRADVQLVERRRFAAAAEAERAGRPRPRGAPAVGVSPGAELTASAVWLSLGADRATIEVRVSESATGAVRAAQRVTLPADAEMVGAARAVVATIVASLREMDRLPEWTDPDPSAAPATYRKSGVPGAAVQRFLEGLAAEEQWNWEAARRSYQAAATAGFVEAEAALARTARLRNGGTLGES